MHIFKHIHHWQQSWQRNIAVQKFEKSSFGPISFYTLIVASAVIGSIGLLQNNEAVVIGAMLVAPLVTPLSGFALGIVMRDLHTIRRSLMRVLFGTALILLIGFLLGLLGWNGVLNEAVMMRSQVISWLDVFVAIAAGFVAALALASQNVHAHLSGAAIALALVPPLAVAGLHLSQTDYAAFHASAFLFLLNAVGIVLMSMMVFVVFGFQRHDDQV